MNMEPNRDENDIRKQVLDTHLPDNIDVDVKPLVHIVEEILQHASINGDVVTDTDVRKFHQTKTILMLNVYSHVINKVASEMSSKRLPVENAHTCALSLFDMVANYHWDAKLALILAAFVLKYGEFWLLAQISSAHQLAKSMAVLRRVPTIMEDPAPLKLKFDAVNKLIYSVIELTRCIIQFKKLPSMYINSEVPAMARALSTFPIAACWSVRRIIACAEWITSLTRMGNEYEMSFTDMSSSELSSLLLKINHLIEFLRKQLEECHRLIGERKEMHFRKLIDRLLVKPDTDNMEILKTLLNTSDGPLPLFDGAKKQRVSLEVLRKRTVLLLISRPNMSYDQLDILEYVWGSHIQGSAMDTLYDLVWVPLVDPYIEYTKAMHRQFERKRKTMPWYSVSHPSNIDRAVKKSIGDRWRVGNKPILVVLDPQGREMNPNAMHMMWIWGSVAFPFTIAREEALWRDETWRLELLVNGMDPTILNWVSQGKYILLFGGVELECIRMLANHAWRMSTYEGIPLETAYVGISKNLKKLQRVIVIINKVKLSYCWQDINLIRFFWTRLKSMLISRIQFKVDNDKDVIILELKKLLGYDMVGSWALLCKGSQLLTIGHPSTMQRTFASLKYSKEYIPSTGFDLPFTGYHDTPYIEETNCCRIEFPILAGAIPERMRCPECYHFMDKYIDFLCFHDKPGPPEPFQLMQI